MGRYGADAVLRRGVIRMGIYFDNAATTLKKPDCVINAVTEALKNLGNSSRGAYEASMDASRLIYDTRVQLAALFHAGNRGRLHLPPIPPKL